MKTFVRNVNHLLEQGEPVVLATIVGHSGSTPRSSGAKMALPRSGNLLGTVGGGIVEAQAMDAARGMLDQAPGAAAMLDMDLTSDLAAGTDMICGGRMTLLLERLDPDDPGGKAWGRLDRALRTGQTSVLVTRFASDPNLHAVEHFLIPKSDQAPTELACLRDQALERGAAVLEDSDGLLTLAEPFVPPAPLFLFGAGHVSRATARMAGFVGFRVVVLDDRADFANTERFPDADDIVVLSSFEKALDGLGVDETAYLVILTRGHAHDKTVLAQALNTPAGYVGMIGSKKKRDAIYEALRDEGVSEADIARCHSPIGLALGAQTPEEIALSIVSELVAVRAGVREGKGA